MEKYFNYQKICQDLLKDLPERTKEVISRRFGLERPTSVGYPERETLESIGESHGITRERVRQIGEDGFLRLKLKAKNYQPPFQYFIDQLKTTGNLKKEETLLNLLGGQKFQNQVYFLLTLGEPFERFSENKDFYSLWSIKKEAITLAQKFINSTLKTFEKRGKPLSCEELFKTQKAEFPEISNKNILHSYLEISKKILQNSEELFGLKDWPEINPRGVKDRAYLVFKQANTPLHFTEVTRLIGQSALVQTVHNELIRDPRFVLVGRGLYALNEWGYQPGVVKDVISKVLKEAKKPLTKRKILEKVLKQRLVKENTILLNLQDKKYFLRDSQGKYKIKEA